ncbi:MAG: hypothetical protein AAGA99_22235 [Actinomycetota bacterium]
MESWSPSDTIAVVAVGVAALAVFFNGFTAWRHRLGAERRAERELIVQRRDGMLDRFAPTLNEVRSIVDTYGSAWATTSGPDHPDELGAVRSRSNRAIEDLAELETVHPSGRARDAATELKRLVADYRRSIEAAVGYAHAVSRGEADLDQLTAIEDRTADKTKPVLDAVARLTDRLHDDPKEWEGATV